MLDALRPPAVTAGYSFGVGHDVSWDVAVAGRGIDLFFYDHTVKRLPEPVPRGRFVRTGIRGREPVAGQKTIEQVLADNGHAGRRDLVLKMDIEGAELEIVPKLLATNATRLLDVFLWECHAKWKGVKGKCQCVGWEEELRRAGVRRVYREPYRFAPAEKYRAAAWNATRPMATTPTPKPTTMSKDLEPPQP